MNRIILNCRKNTSFTNTAHCSSAMDVPTDIIFCPLVRNWILRFQLALCSVTSFQLQMTKGCNCPDLIGASIFRKHGFPGRHALFRDQTQFRVLNLIPLNSPHYPVHC